MLVLQVQPRNPGAAQVVLTSHVYLMGREDVPRLASKSWAYIVIDEGHRLKNSACKLNAELQRYHTKHRLLLTGVLSSGFYCLSHLLDVIVQIAGWDRDAHAQQPGGAVGAPQLPHAHHIQLLRRLSPLVPKAFTYGPNGGQRHGPFLLLHNFV